MPQPITIPSRHNIGTLVWTESSGRNHSVWNRETRRPSHPSQIRFLYAVAPVKSYLFAYIDKMPNNAKTFIVEHLDPELEEWQALEYQTIYRECRDSGATFILSGLPDPEATQKQLGLPISSLKKEGVEQLYSSPEAKRRICLLDPKGEKDINPEDADDFDVFLFGGILGDDPPRDRTGELRAKGYVGRRLGPEQMTTDTAARVTRIVVQQGKRLDEIPFIDRPDIELPMGEDGDGARPNESVSMPFKYVRGEDGRPIMPEVSSVKPPCRLWLLTCLQGMLKLLVEDMDKGIGDLL